MSIDEIVEFLKENCVGMNNPSTGFAVYCSPEWIHLKDLTVTRPQLMRISDDYLKGIIFAKYDYFMDEVILIKKELENERDNQE